MFRKGLIRRWPAVDSLRSSDASSLRSTSCRRAGIIKTPRRSRAATAELRLGGQDSIVALRLQRRIKMKKTKKPSARNQHHPPATVGLPICGIAPTAERGPAAPGVIVPRTTPLSPGKPGTRAGRISHGFVAIRPIPILAPLPDVAVQVVESPHVRLERANSRCFSVTAQVAPPWSHRQPERSTPPKKTQQHKSSFWD